ncbi:RNA polymerase sigma-70 factor [Halosquirtibacter xylanolyticus]|uniref:RNA polymerase sigma-70 factor n=1 Tax=Halosquirtibacter xylanolyticus TaxID=3374599 RepID=UPI003749A424|nr:RNA polymerase sigma-70 factor [Prolixibacteraceae bacterium]
MNTTTNYSELYESFSRRLFYYAQKFVDKDSAYDIIQDVFVTLIDQNKQLDPSTIKSYLFLSVKNRCLNHLEHKSVQGRHADQLRHEIELEEVSFMDRQEQSLIEQNLIKRLEQKVQDLPGKCKEVLLLKEKEMLKNKEIAIILGISIKTVEKHLHRARQLLRDDLMKYRDLICLLIKKNQ